MVWQRLPPCTYVLCLVHIQTNMSICYQQHLKGRDCLILAGHMHEYALGAHCWWTLQLTIHYAHNLCIALAAARHDSASHKTLMYTWLMCWGNLWTYWPRHLIQQPPSIMHEGAELEIRCLNILCYNNMTLRQASGLRLPAEVPKERERSK